MELYEIASRDLPSPPHAGAPAGMCGEARPRYAAGWADERVRYPGEMTLRDLASADAGDHVLVYARFATDRWVHRLLMAEGTAADMEAEREAAHGYAAAALRGTTPAGDRPAVREAAAALARMTARPGPPEPATLLAALRDAATHAARLDHRAGVLAMGRLGYIAALGLGAWSEAARFATRLADHTAGHGTVRAAGRWRRRALALRRRIRRSTDGSA